MSHSTERPATEAELHDLITHASNLKLSEDCINMLRSLASHDIDSAWRYIDFTLRGIIHGNPGREGSSQLFRRSAGRNIRTLVRGF